MIIYRNQKSRVIKGSGIFDWVGNVAGKIGSFLNTNSGTIKNIGSLVGDITKAGATTVGSVKQIVDLVKASKAAKAATQAQAQVAAQAPQVLAQPPAASAMLVQPPLVVPPALQSALNQKSVDILNNLIASATAPGSGTPSSASVGASGAGFKTLRSKTLPGRGLYLQRYASEATGRGLFLTK
jgi:hypothetical protein